MNKLKIEISSLILLGAFSAGIVSGSAVSALEDIGDLSKHNKDTKNKDEVATILKTDNTGKEKEFVRKGTDSPNKADNFLFTDSESKNTNESGVNTRALVGIGVGVPSVGALGFAGNELVKKYWNKDDAAVEYTIPDKGTDTPDANSDSSDLSENENKSKSWLSSVPVWLKVLLVIIVLCFGIKKCVSFFSRKTNNTKKGDYRDTDSESKENRHESGPETSTFKIPLNEKNNPEIDALKGGKNNGVEEKLKEILLGLSNVNGENSDKNPDKYKQKIEDLFKLLHDSLFSVLKNKELDECLNSLVNAFGDNKAILVDLILNDEFNADSLTGLIRMLPFVKSGDPDYSGLCSGFVQLLNAFYKNNSKMGLGLIGALLEKVSSINLVRRRSGLAKFFNLLLVQKDKDSDGAIKGLVCLLNQFSTSVCLGKFATGLANLLGAFACTYDVVADFGSLFNLLNFVFESKDESVKKNLAALIKLLVVGSNDHNILKLSINFVNLIDEEGVLEKFKELLKDKDFKAENFVRDLDVKVDSFNGKAFANKWGIGEDVQSNVDNNNFIEN